MTSRCLPLALGALGLLAPGTLGAEPDHGPRLDPDEVAEQQALRRLLQATVRSTTRGPARAAILATTRRRGVLVEGLAPEERAQVTRYLLAAIVADPHPNP